MWSLPGWLALWARWQRAARPAGYPEGRRGSHLDREAARGYSFAARACGEVSASALTSDIGFQ
jgi:hypothetical protein